MNSSCAKAILRSGPESGGEKSYQKEDHQMVYPVTVWVKKKGHIYEFIGNSKWPGWLVFLEGESLEGQ